MDKEMARDPQHNEKIQAIIKSGGYRYGHNPIYVETPEAWKIWDHFEKRWIFKLKINY